MLRPDAPTERQGKLTLRKEEPIIPSAIHLYLKRLRVARVVAPFLRRILRQRRYARKLGLFRALYLLLAGKFRVHSVVAALTEAAPVVLFSAAVPGQGGTGHVNEQWPEYWRKLFAARGFRLLDPVRRLIREDQRVKFWYRQNLLMFASDEAIAANEKLAAEAAGEPQPELEWVHISMVRKDRSRNALLIAVSRALPVRLKRHPRGPIKAAMGWGHAH